MVLSDNCVCGVSFICVIPNGELSQIVRKDGLLMYLPGVCTCACEAFPIFHRTSEEKITVTFDVMKNSGVVRTFKRR